MSDHTYKVGDTIYSKCRRARIVYQPNWSPSRPWASYRDGSAEKHYCYARQGIEDLSRNYGYRFEKVEFKRQDDIAAPEGGW